MQSSFLSCSTKLHIIYIAYLRIKTKKVHNNFSSDQVIEITLGYLC